MNFFTIFSEYYNKIFPAKKYVINFLMSFFDEGKLLDVACGTGEYANYFANHGFLVDAYDLDEKMIHNAVKTRNANFFVDDMLIYKRNDYYDGIYCIGSGIAQVHDLKVAISNIYQSLKDGKYAIIQTLNYDYIYNNLNRIDEIVAGDIVLRRSFKKDNDKLFFNPTLIVKDKEYFGFIEVKRISKKMFDDIFNELDITDVSYYGNFAKREFAENDQNIIIVMKKTKV